MEILETAALWCVDKAAILLERIGLAVIPLWNRWNWEHDMLTVLLMLASVLLAVVCAGLSLAHPNGKEMEKEEARMDKLGDWGVYYVLACKLFYFSLHRIQHSGSRKCVHSSWNQSHAGPADSQQVKECCNGCSDNGNGYFHGIYYYSAYYSHRNEIGRSD